MRKKLAKETGPLQRPTARIGHLQSKLNRKDKQLKEFVRTLDEQVECRTSAERIVHRQLHSEIEQRKQAEQEIQDTLEYANGIINTVREPLIVLDSDLMVISANRSFYQIFNVKPEETEKQHIYDLGDRQWDIPKLRELLEEILPQTVSFDDFMVEHDFPGIGKRIMLLNARKIYREASHTQLILLAIEDITERKILEEKLIALASHDELTGCVNFRSTMNLLENEIVRSKRYKKKFSIIMIDIDNFKRINDEYGHLAGNDVLVAFANVVRTSVRNIDVVGRYGGDEFIIILPETDRQQAIVVLGRMQHGFGKTKITSAHFKKVKDFRLNFSAGISTFPDPAKDLKGLIGIADRAMRKAKGKGKNQAVLGGGSDLATKHISR